MNTTTRQANRMPTRKVQVGGISGALTVVVVWLLNTFVFPPQHQMPAEIASALTVVISFIASYLVPPAPEDTVVGAQAPVNQ